MDPKEKKRAKALAIAVFFIAVVAVIILLGYLGYRVDPKGMGYDPGLADKRVQVTWQSVRVRKYPNTAQKILGYVQKGDTVILTGRIYKDPGLNLDQEPSQKYWVEVVTTQYDKAWIIQAAIQ